MPRKMVVNIECYLIIKMKINRYLKYPCALELPPPPAILSALPMTPLPFC